MMKLTWWKSASLKLLAQHIKYNIYKTSLTTQQSSLNDSWSQDFPGSRVLVPLPSCPVPGPFSPLPPPLTDSLWSLLIPAVGFPIPFFFFFFNPKKKSSVLRQQIIWSNYTEFAAHLQCRHHQHFHNNKIRKHRATVGLGTNHHLY